jgi:trans-aconitate methyltransferase
MDIGPIINGIDSSFKLLDRAAQQLSDPEMKSIEEAIVLQDEAKFSLYANTAVLRTAMEMQKSIIDMLA